MRNRSLPRPAPVFTIAAVLFLDMTMYGLVVPVIPVYSARLGIGPAGIGGLFAAYGVALLAATPVFGGLGARVERRHVIVGGLGGLALATILFAASTSFTTLLVARALQGIAAAASWTAGLALVAESTPPGERGRAFGTSGAASSIGTLLGPPLGGILADRWGYRAPFVTLAAVTGLGTIAAAALLAGLRPARTADAVDARTLLRDGRVRAICAFVAIGAGVLGILEPMLPLDLARRLGASASAIGLLFAASTVAYGLATPIVGRWVDRGGAGRPMRFGWLASAAGLPLLALPASLAVQAIVMAAVGVALGFMLTPALRALADAVDRIGGDHAVAYAAYNGAYAVGLMAGAGLGGPLVGVAGPRVGLLVAACAVAVAGARPALRLGSE